MDIYITITIPDNHPWADATLRPDELQITASIGMSDETTIAFASLDGDGEYSGIIEGTN